MGCHVARMSVTRRASPRGLSGQGGIKCRLEQLGRAAVGDRCSGGMAGSTLFAYKHHRAPSCLLGSETIP
jgi:hypothetical protein